MLKVLFLLAASIISLSGCVAMVDEHVDDRRIKSFMVPSRQVEFVLGEGDKISMEQKSRGQLRVFEPGESSSR